MYTLGTCQGPYKQIKEWRNHTLAYRHASFYHEIPFFILHCYIATLVSLVLEQLTSPDPREPNSLTRQVLRQDFLKVHLSQRIFPSLRASAGNTKRIRVQINKQANRVSGCLSDNRLIQYLQDLAPRSLIPYFAKKTSQLASVRVIWRFRTLKLLAFRINQGQTFEVFST